MKNYTGAVSPQLCTKHPWDEGIDFVHVKGHASFPTNDDSDFFKIIIAFVARICFFFKRCDPWVS